MRGTKQRPQGDKGINNASGSPTLKRQVTSRQKIDFGEATKSDSRRTKTGIRDKKKEKRRVLISGEPVR